MAAKKKATADDVVYLRGTLASVVEAIQGLQSRVADLESQVRTLTTPPSRAPRRRSRA